ncbi:acyl-CoA N-acyltransferase [Irpex rosettiformis]|uniref:Acyl-CoA N-acyltransferase n=1 Tax=Irpex rosettiformis TaxID=378272 RepID=A0ACB8TSB3_9APHY|nr:acyl-CoA N-acyltransferase [Irpex rosettiformis]
MAFLNSYKPSIVQNLSAYSNFGPDPYDINFSLSIDFTILETGKIKPVPFIPRLYAEIYLDQTIQYRDLNVWYSAKPPSSLGEMLYHLEGFRTNPSYVGLAIIDKGRPDPAHPSWDGSLAGFIALANASPQNLGVEIGSRTYITSHAVGILLRYCLELPTARPVAGLGLRRVEWGATKGHDASAKAAERMGFKREGVMRWHRVVYNVDKEGPQPREGDPLPDKLRSDTEVFSFCSDDWEEGGRELVRKVLERKA